jgi:hypothetical protein
MNALTEGHGYQRTDTRDLYQQAVVKFLSRYLVGRQDQGNAP